VPLPLFVKLPRNTLNYMYYSQTVGGYQGQGCINALYMAHIIFLAEDFDVAEGADTLVHELVHHFEFVSERPLRCSAEAEREAYEIQARWAEQTGQGVPPHPLFLTRLTGGGPHR
jgi:hypothetical protein